MKPVKFPQANGTLPYTVAGLAVHVWRNGEEVVSVWRLSLWERLRVLLLGRCYLRVICPKVHHPASLQTRKPFTKAHAASASVTATAPKSPSTLIVPPPPGAMNAMRNNGRRVRA